MKAGLIFRNDSLSPDFVLVTENKSTCFDTQRFLCEMNFGCNINLDKITDVDKVLCLFNNTSNQFLL